MYWKNFKDRQLGRPIEDKNYLICWLQADGNYSLPHKAFYIEEEDKFFSLENINSYPLIVDIYLELPKIPEKILTNVCY